MTEASHIVISPDDPVFKVADTDPTVSPVVDFYRFANGGWLDANPVPDEYGAWGAGHEVHTRNEHILHELLERALPREAVPGSTERTVNDYYRSGMDLDRIEALDLEPITPLLDAIGAIADHAELATLVAELHRCGIGAFFGVSVMPDFEDSTVNLLYAGQGGLGLPDRDYYLRDDETSLQLLGAYRAHIAGMFGLLGYDDPAAAAATVLDLETAIAKVSYTNVQMRDVDLTTNKVATVDAPSLMPQFGLDRYLEAIGAGSEQAFNIDNEEFYPAIDALISEIPIKDLATYLVWNVVRGTASSLPERFEEEAFNFYGKTLGGQKAQKDRWKRVLGAATSDIGQLVSQMYVAENFPPEAKERMEQLVENLLASMRLSLESLTWMSDATRREALAKLSSFGYKIGYPDEWRDYSALVVSDDTWLANRIAAAQFEFQRHIAMLGRPVDPHEWVMAPHVVNAYYHPQLNEIVFPAGILQPPFFDLDADDAVNYGAIGAIIGHEITHGFDDQGSRYDANGNVRDWWTSEDRGKFEKRAQVVIDQYSAYEIEEGLNVNGELTLGENIADVGGLKIAFAALQEALGGNSEPVAGLTPAQRFYLSWATTWRSNYTDEYLRLIVNSDPHSPNNFRCDGPFSNLATFAEAFGIGDDNPATRPADHRVDIW
ncbi:MAG: M13 family metallopeptidase [Acidimicrobiia bacterium]|nr:MAG: M13 family metallopeptidase [Acidimicrobiia bacterium]